MLPYNKRPTPIIGVLGYKQMSNKQTREGGRKEREVVGRSCRGCRKASAAAAESLSLLPADLVPVFCHRDPLLLGLVIRLWQHSRKDKQSLHQLHQEPWLHTEQFSLLVSVCLLLSSGLCITPVLGFGDLHLSYVTLTYANKLDLSSCYPAV